MSFGYGKLILFGEYAVLEGEPALVVGTEFKAQASWTALNQLPSYMLRSSPLTDYIIEGKPIGTAYYTKKQHIGGIELPMAWFVLKLTKAPRGLYQINTLDFDSDENDEINFVDVQNAYDDDGEIYSSDDSIMEID